MQKKETAIEVKVGALVLFSLALLTAFVLILGDFSFNDGLEFHVQFDNAAGLKPGADVAIAGITVGSVSSLKFIRNENTAESNLHAVAVQVTLRLNPTYQDSVRRNSKFYITTRGLLGEPYIEIATASFDAQPVAAGDILRGVDPPRMELIVAKASELLDIVVDMLDDPDIDTSELVTSTTYFMKNVGGLVGENRENLDASIDNLRITTEQANQLLATFNTVLGDGQQVRAILGDAQTATRSARNIAGKLDNRFDPLMEDATAALNSTRKITDSAERILVGREAQIGSAVDNLHTSSESLVTIAKDGEQIVTKIAAGEGTVGALLADREIYEDMKELLRIIKQQPWKILWKE